MHTAALSPTLSSSKDPSPAIKRYALAGTGVRGWSFAAAIAEDFQHVAEIVALYDKNRTRMSAFSKLINRTPACHQDFDEMIRECEPDALIICTPDASHDELIELAFSRGLDVVVEKPMATTVEKVRRIFALEKQYGRKVRIAFNCRYMPYFLEIKKLLASNPIGEIKNVQLEWSIDSNHGAEYFRRWHAELRHSGGLLVHKSTHHFDLVNWLLDDSPTSVYAHGSLQVFGKNPHYHGENCRTCSQREECPFVMVPDWEGIESLYFAAEHEDHYLRDKCVFRDEVDIYDTMGALVTYSRGAQLAYSLVSYSTSEGFRLTLTGTKGRLEADKFFRGNLSPDREDGHVIRLAKGTPRDLKIEEIVVPPAIGSHSGGDARMFSDIFEGATEDPWNQNAGSDEGAASCLIGIMANESICTGLPQVIPNRATI